MKFQKNKLVKIILARLGVTYYSFKTRRIIGTLSMKFWKEYLIDILRMLTPSQWGKMLIVLV